VFWAQKLARSGWLSEVTDLEELSCYPCGFNCFLKGFAAGEVLIVLHAVVLIMLHIFDYTSLGLELFSVGVN
jgi:hypothetical protein